MQKRSDQQNTRKAAAIGRVPIIGGCGVGSYWAIQDTGDFNGDGTSAFCGATGLALCPFGR
jgi:hypothetical protein